MSWLTELANVYDNNISQVGEFEARRNQRITLLPVSHVMQSAQIEILITEDGDFVQAKVIEKESARTIVPATTASANRANSSAPHYIHDKLAYVAGDYIAYGGVERREKHHQDYYEQMESWAQTSGVSAKVLAVYNYIKKGQVMQDLVNAKILPVDEYGKVINKWNISERGEKSDLHKVVTSDALDAFVRFDVKHKDANDPVIWEDQDLFEEFIVFLESRDNSEVDYCYVTGDQTVLTTQHGSRLRNAGDMSKLISANDKQGFTYRGRFKEPTDAVQIGYEVSQKAHHALRWLIQRQGTYVDSRYFVSFGIEKSTVPDPYAGTEEFMEEDIFAQSIEELSSEQAWTEDLVAAELNKALQGVKHDLEKSNLKNIIVMSLDAATRGRLAIVYYQNLRADLFYDAIFFWHKTCRWIQTYKDKDTNQTKSYIGTPSTYRISEAVYGSRADSRIKKDLYTRLLPCIVEQKQIPKDIIRIIFNRVKNPSSFKGLRESWDATLNIACALINKYYESEGYEVVLQEDNHSRDYLFGRLLGVAEVMERRVLKNRDENRATNATRYFNAFSQHPARTWMVIRKQLTPYFERTGSQTGYYAMLLQQIENQMTVEQMTDDPLGPIFLLGYSSQVQSLYTKKEEKEHDKVES